MRALALALAFAISATSLAAPAYARRGDDRPPAAGEVAVSREKAIDIAKARGMTRLHEVKFDDGLWEIEGWTANGDKIEFDIHPQTGAIVKEEIYRAPR